jgi:deoxyribodipyrimidine photo-lyase
VPQSLKPEKQQLLSVLRNLRKNGLDSYDENRNFAGIDGTSKMSSYLKFGEDRSRVLLLAIEVRAKPH